jgi:Staphylococcal nuclease homologue
VLLRGGQRVRLIGIDAPEIGHDGAPDRPYAQAAKAELARILAASGRRVRLLDGREPRDRYGRLLAHLYSNNGINVSEHLLRLGLAYQVTIPPNDRFRDCYAQAQTDARKHERGLWRLPPVDVAAQPRPAEGFTRIRGVVREVRHTRHGAWIELAGRLQLHIAAEDLERFDRLDLSGLTGNLVDALGWIYYYRGEPRMRLRDPTALRRIASARH